MEILILFTIFLPTVLLGLPESFPPMDLIIYGNYLEDASFIRGNQHSICYGEDLNIHFSSCMKGKTLQAAVLFPKNSTDTAKLLDQITKFTVESNRKLTWTPYFLIVLLEISFPVYFEKEKLGMNGLDISSEVYFIGVNISEFNDSRNTQFYIYELYSLKNRTFFNEVSSGQFVEFTTILTKSDRRFNLQKVPITAVSVDEPGYPLETDFNDDNTTVEFVGGFEVEELRYLRDAMNFSELALKSTGYIRKGPNGTLTGLAVEINQGKADISISSAEFVEYRVMGNDGITYLHPTFETQMLAIFKQPPANSIRDVFTAAFTLELWITVLCMCIVVIGTIYAFSKISRSFILHYHWKDEKVLNENIIMVCSMICQQGWHISPSSISLRIVFFFGWFFALLCYIGYSAALVSILSVEVIPINSFADLLNEKFSVYCDSRHPSAKLVIEQLEDKNVIPKLPDSKLEETIRHIVKGKSTVVALSYSFYPVLKSLGYTDDFACDVLSKVSANPRPVMQSMIVKRGSPLRELFNYEILFMRQSGIKHRLTTNYIMETAINCLPKNSGFQSSLGIKDMITAIGLLCLGYIASFASLIAEKATLRQMKSINWYN